MDTTAIPEFKIAKVGKDRKRKGAGLPFFGGGSGGGAFSGAVGGSGAAAGAGLLGKIGVLALIGTLSAGAWQFGKALRPDETGGPSAKPKLFASHDGKYSDEDLANVIRSNGSSIPNSMGYVKGSMDGMTAEERAKKEAEAAEAARLAEEEAKKAEAEAAAKEPGNVAGAPAGMDPNALMQNTGGDKKEGAFGKKFGALSSSFGSGGGLAGGAGLAGGVNRGFSNAALKTKGNGGKMAAMRGGANPSISKGTKARAGSSNNKGFARRQLGNAFSLSRQASSAGKGETAAQTASSAFDNNNGAGNVISGPGVGAGTGGAGIDAGGSVNPNTGGSAIDPNDEAAPIANNKGKNVTKYQGLINAALMLLAIISVLAILAMIFDKKAWFETIAQAIKAVMVALAAIVTLLGVAIMAQGQYLQGGILTAVGAFVTYIAYTAPVGAKGGGVVLAKIAAPVLVASAVGMLGGALGGMGGKGSSGSMN